MNQRSNTSNMVISALCLALAFILPNFTANIPQIGMMLLPMHIPILLCGFLTTPFWGVAVGFSTPILRSLLYGMPMMFPMAVSMAFELATYALVAALLSKYLAKNIKNTYLTLGVSMIIGRIVWGIVHLILTISTPNPLTFGLFISGAITNSIPGIALQFILIPPIVLALNKEKRGATSKP